MRSLKLLERKVIPKHGERPSVDRDHAGSSHQIVPRCVESFRPASFPHRVKRRGSDFSPSLLEDMT